MRCCAALVSSIVVALAVSLGSLQAQGSEKGDAKSKLTGTWRLVSSMYGEPPTPAPIPKDSVMLKHVTPTHFTWVQYDVGSGQVGRAAGGRYSLVGDSYKEMVEYVVAGPAVQGLRNLIGKEQSFTWKVEGDRWMNSGTLTSGLKIEEVWERVK